MAINQFLILLRKENKENGKMESKKELGKEKEKN
jgi:hypothetical protein